MMGHAAPETRLDDELGLVRYCHGCDEWWPSDEDFWRPNNWSRRALCNACVFERRRASLSAAEQRYRARLRESQVA